MTVSGRPLVTGPARFPVRLAALPSGWNPTGFKRLYLRPACCVCLCNRVQPSTSLPSNSCAAPVRVRLRFAAFLTAAALFRQAPTTGGMCTCCSPRRRRSSWRRSGATGRRWWRRGELILLTLEKKKKKT